MLGLEFVEDRESKRPAPAIAAAVVERSRELGLLLGNGGLHGNVIRLKPPMCWTIEDCEFACSVIDRCLHELSSA